MFQIFEFIVSLVESFIRTIFLPFRIVWSITSSILHLFFYFQYYLSDRCVDIFGDGYGCRIINPGYVFTSILQQMIMLSILVYLGFQMKRLYDDWAKKNGNDNNEDDDESDEE